MRFSIAVLSLLFSVITVAQVSGALVGSTQGYVTYEITLRGQQVPAQNILLNESAQPTSPSGLVQVTVSVLSKIANFTLSNTVNSSSYPEIFPYLVGVNNQSISFETNGINALVHVENTGSVQVEFDGATFTGTSYQLSLSVAYSPLAFEINTNATAVTLPSGLVYSVQLEQINGYVVDARLVKTNLPVAVANGGSLPLGLTIISIALLAAAAFAVPSILIRWRKKPTGEQRPSTPPKSEEKPSYWVD